jgi:hypothetical protein
MTASRLFGAVTQISSSCQYHQTLNENAVTCRDASRRPGRIEDTAKPPAS